MTFMATAFLRSPSPEAGMPRREQGVAKYETRAEPLVDTTVRPPIVVGESVDVEILGQSVEASRDAGGPLEIFFVYALVYLEGLMRLVEPGCDRIFRNIFHAVLQVVHLEDLDVEP
jgi:hypothetical protein